MQNETGPQQQSSTTFGSGENNPTGADAAIAEGYKQQAVSGANWFFWIAAFSVINSVVLLMNGEWGFLIGLGVTQLIDGVAAGAAENLGGTATAVALFLDAMVAGFFVVMGLLARRGMGWAFILGMFVYTLDGLLFLYVQQWLNIAFHAFVLFCIYRGFAANSKFQKVQAAAAMPRW